LELELVLKAEGTVRGLGIYGKLRKKGWRGGNMKKVVSE